MAVIIEVLQRIQEQTTELGKGARESVTLGGAEGAGAVHSAEKETQGRPYCSLELPERRV